MVCYVSPTFPVIRQIGIWINLHIVSPSNSFVKHLQRERISININECMTVYETVELVYDATSP